MKTIRLTEKLRKEMEKVLDDERLDHTMGVAYTAASLSFVHGCDLQKALIAGMLHDCAKNIPDDKKIRLCEKHGIEISTAEQHAPSLLHAKLGAFLAEEQYGVKDEEVLDAIRYHTTGRPKMTLLEKIIFVADYIEPNRKVLPHMEELRSQAFTDLDGCVLRILQYTLQYLKEKAKVQDPMTRMTYEYYRRRAARQKKSNG